MFIKIQNLKIQTIIGIHANEREEKQEIIVNLKIEFDGSKAAQSDHIADTIDYEKLIAKIVQNIENSRYYLLEKLIHHIAEIVLEEDKVIKTRIEITKPEALFGKAQASIIHTAMKNR